MMKRVIRVEERETRVMILEAVLRNYLRTFHGIEQNKKTVSTHILKISDECICCELCKISCSDRTKGKGYGKGWSGSTSNNYLEAAESNPWNNGNDKYFFH